MLVLALLLACLSLDGEPHQAAQPLHAVQRILLAVGDAGEPGLKAAVQDVLRIGADIRPVLVQALFDGRLPGLEGEESAGLRLAPLQERVLLRALVEGRSSALAERCRQTRAQPTDARAVAIAIGAEALGGRGSGFRSVLELFLAARSAGVAADALSGALESALLELLERQPRAQRDIQESWTSLPPEFARAAVRSLDARADAPSFATLCRLLGRRTELDACVLQAAGNLCQWATADEARALVGEWPRYLDSRERAETLAAISALGRLRAPECIPDLIEELVDEDRAVVRAALNALRGLAGVHLPASPSAWRAWYGREETWWQDRMPELLAELARAHRKGGDIGVFSSVLREISGHPLHRAEIVPRLSAMLAHPDERIRILVCESLQRLDSRLALASLVAALEDRSSDVRAAVHAALVAIAGVELPPVRQVWAAHLASGFEPAP